MKRDRKEYHRLRREKLKQQPKLQIEIKKCSICSEEKSIKHFNKKIDSIDGFRSECRKCSHAQWDVYYENNKEKVLEKNKEWFDKDPSYMKKYQKNYQKEGRKNQEEWYLKQLNEITKKHIDNPLKRMIKASKTRAKEKGLDFDLKIEDFIIPESCPILGIPIFIGNKQRMNNSPSLDRIDNTKGYIKGNVIVISWRANRLKNDASIEELRKIVEFYSRLDKA